ncbi:hypothetical protein QTO34_016967 [Cnephaeus nilssonii]|uniref:Uncharacterized protein n=1 Tax=Cnephaeus nilssonii TaxID=3371016 RepID=A0AA40LSN1_CNENI|nr:hypothetical protein QTO34_016967 [Eptesicus nilssonii]
MPAFVMTINKSQGQTLDTIGIFLSEPIFTHGKVHRTRGFPAAVEATMSCCPGSVCRAWGFPPAREASMPCCPGLALFEGPGASPLPGKPPCPAVQALTAVSGGGSKTPPEAGHSTAELSGLGAAILWLWGPPFYRGDLKIVADLDLGETTRPWVWRGQCPCPVTTRPWVRVKLDPGSG